MAILCLNVNVKVGSWEQIISICLSSAPLRSWASCSLDPQSTETLLDFVTYSCVQSFVSCLGQEGAILVFLPGWDNISTLNDLLMAQQMFRSGMQTETHIQDVQHGSECTSVSCNFSFLLWLYSFLFHSWEIHPLIFLTTYWIQGRSNIKAYYSCHRARSRVHWTGRQSITRRERRQPFVVHT